MKYILSAQMLILVLWLAVAGCWIGNLVKLLNCDFEPSWKGEIVHAIGLIPPAALVTVWFNEK